MNEYIFINSRYCSCVLLFMLVAMNVLTPLAHSTPSAHQVVVDAGLALQPVHLAIHTPATHRFAKTATKRIRTSE